MRGLDAIKPRHGRDHRIENHSDRLCHTRGRGHRRTPALRGKSVLAQRQEPAPAELEALHRRALGGRVVGMQALELGETALNPRDHLIVDLSVETLAAQPPGSQRELVGDRLRTREVVTHLGHDPTDLDVVVKDIIGAGLHRANPRHTAHGDQHDQRTDDRQHGEELGGDRQAHARRSMPQGDRRGMSRYGLCMCVSADISRGLTISIGRADRRRERADGPPYLVRGGRDDNRENRVEVRVFSAHTDDLQ